MDKTFRASEPSVHLASYLRYAVHVPESQNAQILLLNNA
jgi:hypothetical protein